MTRINNAKKLGYQKPKSSRKEQRRTREKKVKIEINDEIHLPPWGASNPETYALILKSGYESA